MTTEEQTTSNDKQDVTRAQWFAARAELLIAEKAHTQARARLASARRALPRVRVDATYSFVGAEGAVSLSDLFGEQSQLLIYHLMFGPGWSKPCIGCAAWADAINGTTEQFAAADARLIAVSRAPYETLARQAGVQGWSFPWYSAFDTDFNYDFYASSRDESPRSVRYITADGKEPDPTVSLDSLEQVEFDRGENHGVSVFQRDSSGQVFHTYSAYNRGIEALNGAMGYLDLLPDGRRW